MRDFHSILPACAVAVGVALVTVTSAFTEAPKKSGFEEMYTFQYNGVLPSDISSVEDNSDWTYTPGAGGCDAQNEAACTIRVSEASVDHSGTSTTLSPNFTISAADNSLTGTAYVLSVSDNTAEIVNKTAD